MLQKNWTQCMGNLWVLGKKAGQAVHEKSAPIKIPMSSLIKLFLTCLDPSGVRFCRIQDIGKKSAASQGKGDPFSSKGLDDTRCITTEENTITGDMARACSRNRGNAPPGAGRSNSVMNLGFLAQFLHLSVVGYQTKIGKAVAKIRQATVAMPINPHFQSTVITRGVGDMDLDADPSLASSGSMHT